MPVRDGKFSFDTGGLAVKSEFEVFKSAGPSTP
jgi:hypothetical protein